jgi:hypothetical protein
VPAPLLQSQPSRPTGRIPLAPKRLDDRVVRALHCRWTAHRRPWSRTTHGFTALPLASSTTSPYLPLQVKANPFSSSSRSPPLTLLYHPRAHSTRHRQPLGTADELRLKHHRPRAPSDSSDRAFVHPRATSPHPEDCRGCQSSASFFHGHLTVDNRLGAPQTRNPQPPNSDCAVAVVLPRLNRAVVYQSPGELPVFPAAPNRFPPPPTPRPS